MTSCPDYIQALLSAAADQPGADDALAVLAERYSVQPVTVAADLAAAREALAASTLAAQAGTIAADLRAAMDARDALRTRQPGELRDAEGKVSSLSVTMAQARRAAETLRTMAHQRPELFTDPASDPPTLRSIA